MYKVKTGVEKEREKKKKKKNILIAGSVTSSETKQRAKGRRIPAEP